MIMPTHCGEPMRYTGGCDWRCGVCWMQTRCCAECWPLIPERQSMDNPTGRSIAKFTCSHFEETAA